GEGGERESGGGRGEGGEHGGGAAGGLAGGMGRSGENALEARRVLAGLEGRARHGLAAQGGAGAQQRRRQVRPAVAGGRLGRGAGGRRAGVLEARTVARPGRQGGARADVVRDEVGRRRRREAARRRFEVTSAK